MIDLIKTDKTPKEMDVLLELYKECIEIIKTKSRGFSKNVFPLKDGSILCIPGENGEERYPYGFEGYNFWIYSSGYMHANDGLFSTFLRPGAGEDNKVSFFAKIDEKVISLLYTPVFPGITDGEIKHYTVFSKDAAYFYTSFEDMLFCVIVSVGKEKETQFLVYAINNSDKTRDIKLSSYFNPYLRNSIFETSEDKWFRCSRVLKDNSSFLFSVNEDLSRTESVTNFGVICRKTVCYEGSRFIDEKLTTSPSKYKGGINHSLNNVITSLTEFKEQDVCAFTENAIAADLISYEIGKNSFVCLREELRFSTSNKEEDAYKKLLISEFKKADHNTGYDAVMKFEGKNIGEIIDPEIMTSFMSSLSKQVEFCSEIKGYVQLSPNSLIGIRDVFQALEGYIYLNPEKARKKMTEALEYVLTNGRCPRQYALFGDDGKIKNIDLREFIDQGCWVIDCVASYLKATNDTEFLNTLCNYCVLIDEEAKKVEKSNEKASVLDHLIRITDYLLSNTDPDTGCIMALYGDWNDALDGLGVSDDPNVKFGNGVSVMATLQVYKNLTDMIQILTVIKDHLSLKEREKIDLYERSKENIKNSLLRYAVINGNEEKARILHGWGDNRRYFVGSFNDPDGKSRHGVTSNAFWVLCGLEKECSMKKEILNAYEALDSKYGYRTFAPAFERNTKGVGRIYKLPMGTAENGASYIHATTFAIMSLFMIGESKTAWEQIKKILPFTHEKVSCSPFVMPNSYGYNKELNIDGESMQDWQTGSSNVLFKTVVRLVFGFDPGYNELTVCPAKYCPFEKISGDFVYHGKKIHIEYTPKETARTFLLNGKTLKNEFSNDLKTEKVSIEEKELKDDNILIIR